MSSNLFIDYRPDDIALLWDKHRHWSPEIRILLLLGPEEWLREEEIDFDSLVRLKALLIMLDSVWNIKQLHLCFNVAISISSFVSFRLRPHVCLNVELIAMVDEQGIVLCDQVDHLAVGIVVDSCQGDHLLCWFRAHWTQIDRVTDCAYALFEFEFDIKSCAFPLFRWITHLSSDIEQLSLLVLSTTAELIDRWMDLDLGGELGWDSVMGIGAQVFP